MYETLCHILTQNAFFKVGVDVGIYAGSVVIYKAMKWNCELCKNTPSLVRNETFRFTD